MRNYGNYPFHIQCGITEREQLNLLDVMAALRESPRYSAFMVTRPRALRFILDVVAPQVVAQMRQTQKREENQNDLPLGFTGL